MISEFYRPFDTEYQIPGSRSGDARTPFEQDRDRIIYTSSFRRLQAKTQVFLAGEYDFYRTRLTHSIEVAQIGRSLCTHLFRSSDHLSDSFQIDSDLVEAVCLAHDLGHPPFGHTGERTLNRLMAEFGGFEGNAQSLRLITEAIYSDSTGRHGMNPSRAFIDGILKYKTIFHELVKRDGGRNHYPSSHFLYDEQKSHVDFVLDGPLEKSGLSPGRERDAFRSIECQIMDWADDTAYSLNDILDSVNAGFIQVHHLERWAGDNNIPDREATWLGAVTNAIRRGESSRMFSRKVGDFIRAATLREHRNFMSESTNRYRFYLAVDPDIRSEADLYARIARSIVFDSTQIKQLEYKVDRILSRIFEALSENYVATDAPEKMIALLPESTHAVLVRTAERNERARLVCDYIAGMTDGFAIRTYRRLFEPDFGSIVDLV